MPNTQYPISNTQPRILFVTTEAAFVPARAGNRPDYIGACSGCFGDFLAELITVLLNLGVDVHVTQPDYRKIFEMVSRNEQTNPNLKLPSDRVHLAEDRAFYYSKPVKSNYEWENIEISLDFQREVINQIAPRVQPDLIHKRYCNNRPNEHDAGKRKNERVIGRSVNSFNNYETAYRYVDLYERILQRPLVTPEKETARAINANSLTKASDGQTVSYRKARSANSHVIFNEQISTSAMASI